MLCLRCLHQNGSLNFDLNTLPYFIVCSFSQSVELARTNERPMRARAVAIARRERRAARYRNGGEFDCRFVFVIRYLLSLV